MAIKAKVTLKLGTLQNLTRLLSQQSVLKPIGEAVISGVLDSVSRGVSPVRGLGRFVAYSGASDRRKYPFSVRSEYPNKKLRPVNLSLDGSMLSSIKSKIENDKLFVGIFGGKHELMAETHNEGTQENSKNKVPKRKFLPTGRGEDFIVSIQRAIKDLFVKAIDDILK